MRAKLPTKYVALAVIVASCTFPSVTYDDASTPDATTDASAFDGSDGAVVIDAGDEADPCDRDRDNYRATSCDGGDDCDDNDSRVHPEAGFVSDVPDGATKGDWNCDGTVTLQYGVIPSLCANACTATGFAVAQGCGITAPFEQCAGTGVCFVADAGTMTQGCK